MRFLRILLFDTTSGLQLVQLRLKVLNLLKHSPLLPLMCVLSVLHEIQYLIHSAAQLTQHLGVLAIYIHSGPFDWDQAVDDHAHAVLLVLVSVDYGVLNPLYAHTAKDWFLLLLLILVVIAARVEVIGLLVSWNRVAHLVRLLLLIRILGESNELVEWPAWEGLLVIVLIDSW